MRLEGTILPNNKRMEIALTAVYGVGRSLAKTILKKAKIDKGKKPAGLTSQEEGAIRKLVDELIVGGDLKRKKSTDIKRLIDIKTYRGDRHSRRLPSRGQNTKTNSRTVRGNKRSTAGSGRVKVQKK